MGNFSDPVISQVLITFGQQELTIRSCHCITYLKDIHLRQWKIGYHWKLCNIITNARNEVCRWSTVGSLLNWSTHVLMYVDPVSAFITPHCHFPQKHSRLCGSLGVHVAAILGVPLNCWSLKWPRKKMLH